MEIKYIDTFKELLHTAVYERLHKKDKYFFAYQHEISSWANEFIKTVEERIIDATDRDETVEWTITYADGKIEKNTVTVAVLDYIGRKCNDYSHIKNVFKKYLKLCS